jgi:hypothetical protein
MTVASDQTTSEGGSYVRGSGGIDVDARRLARIVLLLCLVGLAAVAAATSIEAAGQRSRQSALRTHGVPVRVSVTNCIGVGSGVGQGVTYFTCRGDYTLGGHTYDEVVGGTRSPYRIGTSIAGVAVPGHPAELATAASVAKDRSSWTPFVTPVILWALTVAAAVGWVALARRNRAPADGGPPQSCG